MKRNFLKRLLCLAILSVMIANCAVIGTTANGDVPEYKVLFIGNSFTEDVTDAAIYENSMLYNIMSAMVGNNAKIAIGAATSGGKSLGWHATQAEADSGAYTFRYIDSNTPNSFSYKAGVNSLSQIAKYTDWDAIVIQPYGTEVRGLVDSTPDVATKFNKLSLSVPYMLDKLNSYNSAAKVYLYLITSATETLDFDANRDDYNKIVESTVAAESYVGTTSGKTVSGIVPVGTASQNLRSTYFSKFDHNYYTSGNVDYDVVKTQDPHKGIQRDGVHLSATVGRYTAALTAAKYLIPAELVDADATLPGPRDSGSVGKIPQEYVDICQKAADAAVLKANAATNRFGVTNLKYRKSPVETGAEYLAKNTVYVAGMENTLEFVQQAEWELERIIGNDVKAAISLKGNYTAPTGNTAIDVPVSVTLSHGYTTQSADVTLKVSRPVEISTTVVGNGRISPYGIHYAPYGTDTEFTFTADEGYEVVKVTVDGNEIPVCDKYTFSAVSAPHTISVEFDLKNPFTDVDRKDWFCDEVLYAYSHSLVKGITDTTFEPQGYMTRAMAVTIIWRIAGEPTPIGACPFTDLTQNWYRSAVQWAADLGITTGRDATTFAPDDLVTRQDFVTFLFRYENAKAGADTSGRADLSSFPDAQNLTYGKDAVAWAVHEGLMNGVSRPDGKVYLEPKSSTTRAQGTALLTRFHQK